MVRHRQTDRMALLQAGSLWNNTQPTVIAMFVLYGSVELEDTHKQISRNLTFSQELLLNLSK